MVQLCRQAARTLGTLIHAGCWGMLTGAQVGAAFAVLTVAAVGGVQVILEAEPSALGSVVGSALVSSLFGAVVGIPGGLVFGLVGGAIGGRAGWIIAGLLGGLFSGTLLFPLAEPSPYSVGPPVAGAAFGYFVARALQKERSRIPLLATLREQLARSALNRWPWWLRFTVFLVLPGCTMAAAAIYGIPRPLRPGIAVATLAYSPDGRWLAATGEDEGVQIYNVRAGRWRSLAPATTAAYDPAGSFMATGRRDGPVELRDPRTTAVLRAIATGADALALSPDSALLATAVSEGDRVSLWEPHSGRFVRDVKLRLGFRVRMAFSPAGDTFAINREEGDVLLWDTRSWRRRASVPAQMLREGELAFSRDGNVLYTSSGRRLQAWNVGTGAQLTRSFRQPRAAAVAVHPHTGDIAVGTWMSRGTPAKVRVYDARTGNVRWTLPEEGQSFSALAFSPDGHTLATPTRGGAIRLWRSPSRGATWELARLLYWLYYSEKGPIRYQN